MNLIKWLVVRLVATCCDWVHDWSIARPITCNLWSHNQYYHQSYNDLEWSQLAIANWECNKQWWLVISGRKYQQSHNRLYDSVWLGLKPLKWISIVEHNHGIAIISQHSMESQWNARRIKLLSSRCCFPFSSYWVKCFSSSLPNWLSALFHLNFNWYSCLTTDFKSWN